MDVEECQKCKGSGEIAIDARTCRYVASRPAPVDREAVAQAVTSELEKMHKDGVPMCMREGEARALILLDYGQEEDLCWLCVQQEGKHKGELWTWHNSEVRMPPNRTMLRS